MSRKRPLRTAFEDATEDLPRGPLGAVGGGNIIGAGGFLAVESAKPFFEFVPGLRQPGYTVTAHGTRNEGGFEIHELTVTAVSENVARFVAQYVAAPSNIDYATAETEIVDFKTVTERRTYSTYNIEVAVDERGEIE